MLRNLYRWVFHWAQTPYGTPALFAIAVAESSFFPIPPDILLIALSFSVPKKAFRYATICTIGSVLGGILGYFIGVYLMEWVGLRIINFYSLQEAYLNVKIIFHQYGGWAVAIAGFTPIPYKLFTIASGAFSIPFGTFVIASVLSRSARFFLVGASIYFFGEKMKIFIDRYFNVLTFLFFLLFILGWFVIKAFVH